MIPARSYFNFCIHSEIIHDDFTYEALLKFAEEFYNLTGEHIAICLSTPFCPLVAKAMSDKGMRRDHFDSRALALSKYARIGYHGHFYRSDNGRLNQISRVNYDRDTVLAQMRMEMGWFKEIGLAPKIYVAGWWFLTEDIVLELERLGVLIDVSIRKGRDDTFGTRYLEGHDVPEYGKPFVLPPSRSIIEIQSIFGPNMPPALMRYHLMRYLNRGMTGSGFFVFPLHDWDIPKYYKNIVSNIRAVSRADRIWMDILNMREHASRAIYGEDLLNKALRMTDDFEPWPRYFESKAREFATVSSFFGIDNGASILEVGCGNGFTSSLLAGAAKIVVALDLPYKNPTSHSIGIDTACRFINAAGVKNVRVIGGSAQELPFDDESFDIIFSGYMLQYVPDKSRAIGEMRRVLKKGGIIITIVPNFTARLAAPIMQYTYLIRRSFDYLKCGFSKRAVGMAKSPFAAKGKGEEPVRQTDIWSYFLLRPDGAYKSFGEEFVCHMPGAWRRLFERERLEVVKTFSAEVVPLALGYIIRRINKLLGVLPFIKECGYSIGIVARKS